MPDTRRKDVAWLIDGFSNDLTVPQAHLAVLMDLRDEMKRLNNLLHCQNFLAIPYHLERIRLNTRKPKKRKKRTTTT